jgi:hypothetical protein
MIALSPRTFVHRGSVSAVGFLIRCDAMRMSEARNRVLDLWRPGVQVTKGEDFGFFLVTLPTPMRVIAGEAPGEPLVRQERLLVALPLEAGELDRLSAPGESLVFANAGQIQVIPLESLAVEDMSRWIDTDSLVLAEVKSLGAPPVAPTFTAVEFDSRKMPGVPPASSELQNLLAELRGERTPAESARKPLWNRLRLVNLLNAFGRLFEHVRKLSFSLKAGVRTTVPAPAQPPAARTNPVVLWFRRSVTRLFNLTRFSQLLSLKHGRYLVRMMAMLQSGDIDEGLRHAIPLSDAPALGERRIMSWFFNPRPRSNLSINPFRKPGQSTSTWTLHGDLFQYLRNLYRQAFQRLEALGRIEEAAFVLTELLSSHAEAVSFLEKHGRLSLAAEIAEAKMHSPVMAIRLWWLAKERKRAIALAIRTGEFERAIRHLGTSHPQEAKELRLVWAERLAASGKYIAAVEAVWPLPDERHRAVPWLDQAIELGGTAGGIALARKAGRFPESFPEVLPQVEKLLGDQTGELAGARSAFGDNLRHETRSPESQTLARMAVRSLVRDVQRGFIEATHLRHLLDYTEDASLRADVPRSERLQVKSEDQPRTYPIEIAAGDVGRRSISDIALLPDGKMLLALGESGLLFLSRDGRPIAESNQPAHKLVLSDDGSRAIGIAPRGPVSRLVLVDVAARTASYWCDTTITAHTPNFDGSAWFVADGADVFLIDTLARGFEALWRVPDLSGSVRALQRNQKKQLLYVVSDNREQLTLWTFEQPSCVLRAKSEYAAHSQEHVAEARTNPRTILLLREAVALSEQGDIFEQIIQLEDGKPASSMIYLVLADPSSSRRIPVDSILLSGRLRSAACHEGWIAIPAFVDNSIDVFRLEARSGFGRPVARLQGATEIAIRFTDQALVCADDRGRVLALDAASGRIIRDLRV